MPELTQEQIDQLTGLTKTVQDYATKAQAGLITQAELKEYQAKIDADRVVLETKLEQAITAMKRPVPGGDVDGAKEIKRLFVKSLRVGAPTPEYAQAIEAKALELEVKDMTVTDLTTGGIFAPPEFVNDLIRDIREYSPIREIAAIRTTSAGMITRPKKTGTTSVAWTGEVAATSESSNITFAPENIPVHEAKSYIDISRRDIEDAQFDLEAEIRADFAESYGIEEGTVFVSGNGVAKPEGFLTHAGVDHTAHSGDATTIPNGDCIKTLISKVKEYYLGNARFVMNRSTRLALELLVDGVGRYIWQTDYTQGTPGMLCGFPVTLATDMPDVGAGAFPVAFGDFRRGYLIVDRMGVSFLRDPYTQAGNSLVRIHSWKRLGGQVIQAEAIAKLEIGA